MYQRGVSEAPAVRDDNFASESFFGLVDAGGTAEAGGPDDPGAANLSPFCGLPPFISRRLSIYCSGFIRLTPDGVFRPIRTAISLPNVTQLFISAFHNGFSAFNRLTCAETFLKVAPSTITR